MGAGLKYTIDLLKIKRGTERYTFDIDKLFFENFETSTIREGNIKVVVEIEKVSHTYNTHIHGDGTVKVNCDRCLNLIDFPVKFDMDLVVKMVDVMQEDEDEVIYIPMQEGVFDVSQHIYDAIYLALPIRKICEDAGVEGGCDSTVIERLKTDTGADGEADPRWDKLKDLL